VNGVDNTAEFINDIPEDSVVDQHLSMPASPLSRSTNGNNNVQGNNSPLTGRLTPKGHRRTGSDPFAFRQNLPARSSRLNTGSTFSPPVDLGNIDFRGEAITFKATTAGIISSLNYCIDVMNKREEYWKKKFDKVNAVYIVVEIEN
jgi:collagen type IV alpha-3-binding protein